MDNCAIDCCEHKLQLCSNHWVWDPIAAADNCSDVWLELGHFNHEISLSHLGNKMLEIKVALREIWGSALLNSLMAEPDWSPLRHINKHFLKRLYLKWQVSNTGLDVSRVRFIFWNAPQIMTKVCSQNMVEELFVTFLLSLSSQRWRLEKSFQDVQPGRCGWRVWARGKLLNSEVKVILVHWSLDLEVHLRKEGTHLHTWRGQRCSRRKNKGVTSILTVPEP